MIKAITVPVLLFAVTWHTADATSCTDLTKQTCAATFYVTDSCKDKNCACIDGYEAERRGCIEKLVQTPKASIPRVSGILRDASGEVLIDKTIALTCTPWVTDTVTDIEYVWMKGPGKTVVSGENKFRMDFTPSTEEGEVDFACRSLRPKSDHESETSKATTVTVIPATGTFQARPVVKGMTAHAMDGANINLQCVNLPSVGTLTFQWALDGEVLADQTGREYTLTMTPQLVNIAVTCKVVLPKGVQATMANSESEAVSTPSQITLDITGVEIVEHGDGQLVASADSPFTLTCRITDTDLATNDGVITWSWSLNQTDILDQTASTLRLQAADLTVSDTDVYRCAAKVGDNEPRVSVGTMVMVESSAIDRLFIQRQPFMPVEQGYIKLTCIARVRNLTDIGYLWKLDGKEIYRQTDKTIQINGLKAADAGLYQCMATLDLVSEETSGYNMLAPVKMNTVTLNAPVSNVGNELYGIGNEYTLTCDLRYNTPGAVYKWMEDDTDISGETKSTYTLKAKEGSHSYKCQITFNELTSLAGDPLTIDAKNVVKVQIVLDGVVLSRATGTNPAEPVVGSKVKLDCQVTKASGITGPVTYVWMKDDETQVTQAQHEFTAGADTNGDYVCQSVVGSEKVASESVTFTAGDSLKVPNVERQIVRTFFHLPIFLEGTDVSIICRTTSHTEDVVYIWLKDGEVISGESSRTLTLKNVKKGPGGDTGVYLCKAKLGENEVEAAKAVTVEIKDAGLPCLYADDCEGPEYEPVCVANRCECAAGYTKNGDKCSGVAAVVSSVLLLALSLMVSKWM